MDEIERRMRDANPFANVALSSETEEKLRGTRADIHPPRRRPLLPRILPIAAVLIVATLVAVGAFVTLRPTQVHAATPPPLKATPVEGTSAELLRELSMSLDVDTVHGSVVRFESWGLAISGDEPLPTVVIPQEHTIEHRPDGSGSLHIQIGMPYGLDGKPVLDSEVGNTVWEQEFGPGEYPVFYPAPPTKAAEVGDYLSETSGLEHDLTTGDLLNQVTQILAERQLTVSEESALLMYLSTLPDLTPMGTVTDRLGREGIAFSTDTRTSNPIRDILIVSTEGQGILAAETIYLANDRVEIPQGAVMSYFAWKR